MEKRTFAITESQIRQALDIVLRELAHAIVHALPEPPKGTASTSGASTKLAGTLPNGRLLITVADAATMLSVSKATLYRMIDVGDIRTIQIGRSRRVPVSVLQEYVASQLREAM